MYAVLVWLGVGIGLVLASVIGWEIRRVMLVRRAQPIEPLPVQLVKLFRRWTLLDTALTSLFILGLLFLFADLLAVIRDRELYPFYRYGYLISAIIYLFSGVVFLWLRTYVLLRFATIEPIAQTSDEQTTPDLTIQIKDTEHSTEP